MKSETEKAKLDAMRDSVMQLAQEFSHEMEIPDEVKEEFGDVGAIGSMMAGISLSMIDAFFAIRDGEEWRGQTDPIEIARKLLEDVGFGDPS